MAQGIDRRTFLAAAPAAVLTGTGPGDANPRAEGMPLSRYLQYVKLFNSADPRFIEFYHPDVVLELGNATINGAAGIRDFYKEVHAHIHEKVEVTHYVADATGIAAELPSEFKVYKDWPEPNYFKRALKAGEVLRVISIGMYQLDNGKIRHIKAARYKLINEWRLEG
jgi:hypothetical protein